MMKQSFLIRHSVREHGKDTNCHLYFLTHFHVSGLLSILVGPLVSFIAKVSPSFSIWRSL